MWNQRQCEHLMIIGGVGYNLISYLPLTRIGII